MGKLSPKQVENLTESGSYEDGDGLRLIVKDSGRKSWVLRFQLNGKRREMGLGRYPAVGLKAARIEASTQRAQILAGLDPLAVRNAEREARAAAAAAEAAKNVTFDAMAEEYIATHRSGWKSAKHAQQWQNTIKTYASPEIGKLPLAEWLSASLLQPYNYRYGSLYVINTGWRASARCIQPSAAPTPEREKLRQDFRDILCSS